jgi:hypothetical protein
MTSASAITTLMKSNASSLAAPLKTSRRKQSSSSATAAGSLSSPSMCANLLVIEGIPMWPCGRCGASYFDARTLHEIERIKALRRSVAVQKPVAVAAFEATAA